MGACESSRSFCAGQKTVHGQPTVKKSDSVVQKQHIYPIQRQLKVCNGAVFNMIVDGNRLITMSEESNVSFWDLKTGERTHTLRGHTDTVYCGVLHERMLLTGSKDDAIRVWSYEEPFECLKVLKDESAAPKTKTTHRTSGNAKLDLSGVASLCFNGQTLFSGHFDFSVIEWDFLRGVVKRKFLDHTGAVTGLLLINENTLVTMSYDTTVKFWDLVFGKMVQTVLAHDDCVTCFAHSASVLITGGGRDDRTMKAWQLQPHPRTLRTFHGHQGSVRAIMLRDINSECPKFISASVDGTVKEWDYMSGKVLDTMVRFDKGVFCLGTWNDCLLTGSLDGSVCLYDMSKEFTNGSTKKFGSQPRTI